MINKAAKLLKAKNVYFCMLLTFRFSSSLESIASRSETLFIATL